MFTRRATPVSRLAFRAWQASNFCGRASTRSAGILQLQRTRVKPEASNSLTRCVASVPAVSWVTIPKVINDCASLNFAPGVQVTVAAYIVKWCDRRTGEVVRLTIEPTAKLAPASLLAPMPVAVMRAEGKTFAAASDKLARRVYESQYVHTSLQREEWIANPFKRPEPTPDAPDRRKARVVNDSLPERVAVALAAQLRELHAYWEVTL